MSDDKNKRFKPSCSKNLIPQTSNVRDQNVPKGRDDIQDQIIIAPEVMRKCLEQLDLRNLKKVRLVCKSWLQEAQPHLERRGIGLLHESSGSSDRLKKLIKTREKNSSSALPPPFRSIDVSLEQPGSIVLKWLVKQIKNLDSPLMITRFDQGGIPWTLAIQLVTQHYSTLEYLMFSFQCTDETEAFPRLKLEQSFPNLRHLAIGNESMISVNIRNVSIGNLIAGIVKRSPKLETYEHASVTMKGYVTLIYTIYFSKFEFETVKTLKLSINHLLTYPHVISKAFRHLQNLRIVFPLFSPSTRSDLAVTKILEKSVATLKTLNLLRYAAPENLTGFPICPSVMELTLDSFPNSNNILSDCFPSLQVLNVISVDVDVLGSLWTNLPPLSGLKTFRVKQDVRLGCGEEAVQRPILLLNKFPDLELVRLDYSFLMRCCRMIATRHFQVSNLLGGVKHLELNGFDVGFWGDEDHHAPLAAITEIESLTLVNPNASLVRIPFQEMLSLKVLRFPWGKFFNTRKLSGITKRLEKVIITNCCSFPRADGDSWPSNNLQSFFDSAPNAVCGCKDWKETSPDWDLSRDDTDSLDLDPE